MQNNSLIKTIFFILLFLVVLTIFLIIFIIPQIKEYKTKQVVIKKYEKIYEKKIKELKVLKNKRDFIQKKYKNELKRYEIAFDKKEFENFLKKFFTNVNIKDKDKKNLTIKASLNSIEDFFRFVDELKKYKNIVKISFPIVYEVKDNIKKVTFNVTLSSKKLKK